MADKTLMRKTITVEGWDHVETDMEVDVTPQQMQDVAKAGPEIVIFKQTDSGIVSDVFLMNGVVRTNLSGDVLDTNRVLYKVTCATRYACTVDFEVWRAGDGKILTVSLDNERKKVASVNVALSEGDEIGVKLVGTANNPTCRLFCKGSTT